MPKAQGRSTGSSEASRELLGSELNLPRAICRVGKVCSGLALAAERW